MSFFLLGQDPDGNLELLTGVAHAKRKDALAELSRLTADAGFAHWDSEVFVLDLDAGTPVLLVRPAVAEDVAEPEPEPEAEAEEEEATAEEEPEPEAEEPEAEEEPEADAAEAEEESAEAEEPDEEPEADAELEAESESDEEPEADADEPDEELEAEAEPEPEAELEAEEEAEPEPETEPEADEIAAVIEDLESEDDEDEAVTAEAEESVEEEPEAELVDEAFAEAVEEDTAGSLKKALERTAASMEAEGIVAPESVGPAEASAEEEGTEESSAENAWPWDTQATGSFKLDALEEPGVDEGSLVRAAGDDETMAASRPVILGAYDETAVEAEDAAASIERIVEDLSIPEVPEIPAVPEVPEPEASPEPEPEAAPAVAFDTPIGAPPAIAEPEWVVKGRKPKFDEVKLADTKTAPARPKAERQAESMGQPVSGADVAPSASDFIDLDEVPAATQPSGYSASGAGATAEMTCGDCVYFDTCPNKDQRDPATCGSFQWK
ncbi:MAG: hypothetical protein FDZ75_01430 [Actinobacteria bacterium]|nr:MAG: hypothetical protein FDZ75_01430 [Actinomycetota bacterium]